MWESACATVRAHCFDLVTMGTQTHGHCGMMLRRVRALQYVLHIVQAFATLENARPRFFVLVRMQAAHVPHSQAAKWGLVQRIFVLLCATAHCLAAGHCRAAVWYGIISD